MKNFIQLILSIIICQGAGLVGSIFTAESVSTWYPTINKPEFNPPSWVFAPVWTMLFLLMGIALYLIIKNKPQGKYALMALSIFGLQLILNVLWSFMFFGLECPFCAFIEILILLSAILATILAFYKINRLAAYLLLPYLFWVSFAAVLNFYIWQLN
jgi:tryptophan-rich sensory protein